MAPTPMTERRPAEPARRGAWAPRGRACVLACGLGALLAGCTNPGNPLLTEKTAERTRVIESVDFEKFSDTPPINADDVPIEAVRPDPTPAPPPDRMDLEVSAVRAAALENNLDLRVELVKPSIANESVLEEEARFEAAFFGSANIGERDPPLVPPVFPPAGRRFASGTVEAGINVPLRTGGNARVSLPVSGQEGVIPGSHNIYDAELKFSFSQPLLRDAGIDVNTAPITVAKLQSRQQDARTKGSAINILADAETSYWNLYATENALRVRYEQYQRALEQERQAKRLFEEGVVAEVEVTRASAGVASRVQDIISAENTRRQAERSLKRIMNIPNVGIDSPTTLFATTNPRPIQLGLDGKRMAALAVDNRMELLELELQLAVDAISIDVADNQTKPVLDLDYNFSYLGRHNTPGKALGIIADGDLTDWRLGASLQVPLGNKAAKSRLRQAMLQRVLTLDTREQRRQFIRQEVFDALDQLDTSWQQVLAARETVLLQARAYEAEQRQFVAGVRTSTDVLIAESALAEAQLREVQSLASYEVAKIDLALATGTLLGMGRVELTPYGLEPDWSKSEAKAPARGYQPSGLAQTQAETDAIANAASRLKASGVNLGAGRPPAAGGPGPAAAPAAPPATAPAATPPGPPAAASAAPVVAGQAPPAAGGGLSWLVAQNPADYTVQVVGGLDESTAAEFVRAHGLQGSADYFGARVEGTVRYGVVQGSYPTRAAARAAIEALPASLRASGPWIRRVGDVQHALLATTAD